MEQRLPVWREECRSFKKLLTQLQKAFCFLLFSFVLDTFQAISVIFFDSTGTRRRISDLWMCRYGKFVNFTCNAVEITRPFRDALHNNSTPKCERGSEVFLFLVSLKCSRFYPHAHCSPTCGAYILSQRSFFSKMW